MSWYDFFRIAAPAGFATTGVGLGAVFVATRFGTPLDAWLKGLVDKALIGNEVQKQYQQELASLEARYEKLDNIVEEVKKVTHAAESIKKDMAQENWDRQMRWTAKKELYLQVIYCLGNMGTSASLLKTLEKKETSTMTTRYYENLDAFSKGCFEMTNLVALSKLIAPSEITDALLQFRGDSKDDYSNTALSISSVQENFLKLARKDLGYDD